MDRSVALFTYGTLQLPSVQMEKFGRLLDGSKDTLPGYRLERLTVEDPDVVRLSGRSDHPIAKRSECLSDRVNGVVYEIALDELAATDAYEVEPYTRIEVELESGRRAFAYVLGD